MSALNLDRLAAGHAQTLITRLVNERGKRDPEAPDGSTGGTDNKSNIKKRAASVENSVTKALGVLQENGVYACFLYVLAKEKENGRVMIDVMLDLLEDLPFEWQRPATTDAQAVLAHISDKVTTDLEKLLMAREVLEQMLIYARYGAKAIG